MPIPILECINVLPFWMICFKLVPFTYKFSLCQHSDCTRMQSKTSGLSREGGLSLALPFWLSDGMHCLMGCFVMLMQLSNQVCYSCSARSVWWFAWIRAFL